MQSGAALADTEPLHNYISISLNFLFKVDGEVFLVPQTRFL